MGDKVWVGLVGKKGGHGARWSQIVNYVLVKGDQILRDKKKDHYRVLSS